MMRLVFFKSKKMPVGTISKGRKKVKEGLWIKIKSKENKKVLSKKTKDWLDKWVWYLDSNKENIIRNIPSDIIKELKEFKPKKSVKLYRGIEAKKEKLEKFKKLKSYTYEKGLAEAIVSAGEFIEPDIKEGKVEEKIISPEKIIVDFNMLPEQYKKEYINEVIVKS